MAKNKKPKCVMVLTEGPSDRAALTGFFQDLYSLIDEDIEVFFPVFQEESISEDGEIEMNYNGDITSRNGITPDNVLPMLLKLFIHPELKKRPAYNYPKYIHEIIHLVDIDGVYIDDDRIVTADQSETRKLPYYDDQNHILIVKNREAIINRNKRKRDNLKKLFETKRLKITIAKDENSAREKPYRVFYFSTNLDHVLFGKANNESFNKVDDAKKISNDFYGESLKMASFLLHHPSSVPEMSYDDSWEMLTKNNYSLEASTNINILIKDLLKQAKVKDLPENDIRSYQ